LLRMGIPMVFINATGRGFWFPAKESPVLLRTRMLK